MPARQPASALLLMGVGFVFLGGIGFGAVAALTQRKPATAKTDPEPAPASAPEMPAAPTAPAKPEPKKPDPPKKEEPKKDPPKKEEPKKPDPKKPDPPKPEPKKPETISVSYEKDILPIFKAKCLLCHGNPKKDGGLDLRTLKSLMEGGDGGVAGAIAGKPMDSPVWIRTDDGSMPKNPKDKLTKAEMKLLADWINAGAK